METAENIFPTIQTSGKIYQLWCEAGEPRDPDFWVTEQTDPAAIELKKAINQEITRHHYGAGEAEINEAVNEVFQQWQ